MAIVQEPQTAEYDGMPRSAISSGLADYVLAPNDMPAQLMAYVKRMSPARTSADAAPPDGAAWMLKIMGLLRSRTGHDLSNYKQNTIRRRVERRMAVNQVESLGAYVRCLRQTPAELDILFRELLIGVTSFFRDPPAFDAIHQLALPVLLAERTDNLPLRVWVPGCSTGEEAYSLAMLIHEAADQIGRDFMVQVFATDIDHESVERARTAVYPASIAADVSQDRLSRFFSHDDKDFYRVKKALRDQLIFAEQDVIKDPPFSKIDLISCRNLMIYMEPVLQKRLLPLFHYALNPGGYLLLGNSESVGDFSNLFSVIERKWKLYRRKEQAKFATVALGGLPVGRVHTGGSQGTKDQLQGISGAHLIAKLHSCVRHRQRAGRNPVCAWTQREVSRSAAGGSLPQSAPNGTRRPEIRIGKRSPQGGRPAAAGAVHRTPGPDQWRLPGGGCDRGTCGRKYSAGHLRGLTAKTRTGHPARWAGASRRGPGLSGRGFA